MAPTAELKTIVPKVPASRVSDCMPDTAASTVPPKEIAPVVVTERLASSVVGTALPTVKESASIVEPPRVRDEAPAAMMML